LCPVLDVAGNSPSRQTYATGFYLDRALLDDDLANYLMPGMAADDPQLSPLRRGDLGMLPPAIVHVAECDPFHDDGPAYVRALANAGVHAELTDHAGMIHLFYAFSRLIPRATETLAAIGRTLGERLRRAP
jgi:acetyl esterase